MKTYKKAPSKKSENKDRSNNGSAAETSGRKRRGFAGKEDVSRPLVLSLITTVMGTTLHPRRRKIYGLVVERAG